MFFSRWNHERHLAPEKGLKKHSHIELFIYDIRRCDAVCTQLFGAQPTFKPALCDLSKDGDCKQM